jgi:hypothetical protein
MNCLLVLNSFSAIRASKKLFAKLIATRIITTTAAVSITVEIAGLTARLSFRKLCAWLDLVFFSAPIKVIRKEAKP